MRVPFQPREPVSADTINPLRIIKWIIGVSSLLQGLYVLSPLYQMSLNTVGPSTFATVIMNHPASTVIWATVLAVGGLLVVIGLWTDKPQFRSVGFFTLVLNKFFQVLAVFVSGAIFPVVTWLYPLILMLIMLVLWGVSRAEVARL